jgi:hypothetical protein
VGVRALPASDRRRPPRNRPRCAGQRDHGTDRLGAFSLERADAAFANAISEIVLTAVLIAGEHVVVDLTFVRLTTLIGLGLVLGAIKHRYGTASSTITHVGVSTLSTAPVVAVALV